MTQQDLDLLQAKGITPEQLEAQLQRHKTGFPYLEIDCAAQVGHGIASLTDDEQDGAIRRWKQYLSQGGEVMKFVPASGAASRMFKALFEFVDSGENMPEAGTAVDKLLQGLDSLPFKALLDEVCVRLHGMDSDALLAAGRGHDIVAAIIRPEGLNYGGLPKGLLQFHAYPDHTSRTPVEEHLAEGAQTAADANGVVRVHFTVSAEHVKLFEEHLAKVVPEMEKRYGVKYEVSLSQQKPSTDTVAANPDGTPFIEDGHMLFRPGGHGALIANLGDIDSAVVFIKNIDNVVPDSRRGDTVRYKEVLAGYLIEIHDKVAAYLRVLNTGVYDREKLDEMVDFVRRVLCIDREDLDTMSDDNLAAFLKAKFNRPLRVCGMVRNEGEPGGGPYIARNPDGTFSPQILESHQIDLSRPEYVEMMSKATHFNPVDLVCYIKDVYDRNFDLNAYVDSATGFISSKSSHGKELRALELPGLWNGSMSDWNTAFVEVPASTFNPVKTVNDLLRPAHQPK